MPLDIEAMEVLYGGNDEVRLENNTYTFDPELYDPSDVWKAQYRTSILDDGGVDTYDFSLIDSETDFSYLDPTVDLLKLSSPGVFINLNPGTWSTIVTGEENLIIDTVEKSQYGQLFTAKDAIIENVTGSAFNDFIQGNNADNVINSGSGQDVIHGLVDIINGGEGDDEIHIKLADIATGVEDIIDGGGGGDKLYQVPVQITAMNKLEMP